MSKEIKARMPLYLHFKVLSHYINKHDIEHDELENEVNQLNTGFNEYVSDMCGCGEIGNLPYTIIHDESYIEFICKPYIPKEVWNKFIVEYLLLNVYEEVDFRHNTISYNIQDEEILLLETLD